MVLHPAEEYLDALNKLSAAKKEVDNLSSYLLQVVNSLRKDPLTFNVSNVQLRPVVRLAGYSHEMNANDWPSANEIAEKVTALQNAYFRAEYAWFHLSPGDKANLPRFKIK